MAGIKDPAGVQAMAARAESPGILEQARVVLDSPERMNLLGLLMHGLLARNLAREEVYAKARRIAGDVLVRAGEMAVTMRFADGRVTILCGVAGRPRARVSGTMDGLLGVVAEGRMVMPFLSGKIKIGGNPFLLLKMLPLIKAGQAGAP
jgi:hypothetical protein